MNHPGRVSVSLLVVGGFLLSACGKPKATPGPEGQRPAVAAGAPSAGEGGGGESKPAATPQTPQTPADIAEGIKALELQDVDLGVKFAPAVCDKNDKPNEWVYRCRIRVEDSKRNGPGLVEIQIYDRDLVFSEMADGFDKTIAAMTKGDRLQTHPDVKVTTKAGVVSHLDVVCGQAQDPVGMGICILEPNPRMMIISGARPASRHVFGNGDMDRAFNITMIILPQLQGLARP